MNRPCLIRQVVDSSRMRMHFEHGKLYLID